MIIGRIWAAFFSTLTILVIYWFLKKAFDNPGLGLLGAAFFAFPLSASRFAITASPSPSSP
jgi:4-amino-4-deoxy-L-arabinose transferase-like glycosyltransferase